MKIQTQDLYHGAVLTQITEHPSFKALNKVDSVYGHYLVNHDIRLFVKYLSKTSSPWSFSLHSNELQAIIDDIESSTKVFLCLVCGQETICALNVQEITTLIDLNSKRQFINVTVATGGSIHVSGSNGDLTRTIKHNSFPNKLFIVLEKIVAEV
jgi:hypothetical protein